VLVNTRQLFLGLLRDLEIDQCGDVGSMDGTEALAFRARLPGAQVWALEPHPGNLARMQADPRLGRAGIRVIGAAASDRAGQAGFYLVDAGSGPEHQVRARRGMSSLHARHGVDSVRRVEVTTLRLDELLRQQAGERIALWIDVEGKAYEAIEGLREVCARVQLIHVELESLPCIAPVQCLAPQVHALLLELGFEALATDLPRSHPQFNAVYLRRGQPARLRWRIALRLWRARWRRWLVSALRTGCPACLGRLIAWRARLAR
jgi:FkbM family methyltransferase